MNRHIDIDRDQMQSIGGLSANIVGGLARDIRWDGQTITKPGTYAGIKLAEYHEKTDLFDGPSISKSGLKWLLPAHGGSPKAFWGRWKYNPDHVTPKSTDALDFGKATHCLLLGDEDFNEGFAERPAEFRDYKSKAAQEWKASVVAAGKTPVTPEQMERISKMRDDAAQHPLVKSGLLSGNIERSMFAKDPKTGIWLKSRPDAWVGDGFFVDLKTTSSMSEDFIARQAGENGYFLQAAMTRMICRELDLPFHTFVLVYVLNDDVPDTAHVELNMMEIDRAERVIRWSLDTIRACLDANEWPGARPFNDGTIQLQLKTWDKERLDQFLDMEDKMRTAA